MFSRVLRLSPEVCRGDRQILSSHVRLVSSALTTIDKAVQVVTVNDHLRRSTHEHCVQHTANEQNALARLFLLCRRWESEHCLVAVFPVDMSDIHAVLGQQAIRKSLVGSSTGTGAPETDCTAE